MKHMDFPAIKFYLYYVHTITMSSHFIFTTIMVLICQVFFNVLDQVFMVFLFKNVLTYPQVLDANTML